MKAALVAEINSRDNIKVFTNAKLANVEGLYRQSTRWPWRWTARPRNLMPTPLSWPQAWLRSTAPANGIMYGESLTS